MFDIGWQELFLIGVVTLVVVGPKDLPRVLRTGARFLHKARAMSREFQNGLAEMAREAELDDIKQRIEHAARYDLGDELRSAADPTGKLSADFDPAEYNRRVKEAMEGGSRRGSPPHSSDDDASPPPPDNAMPPLPDPDLTPEAADGTADSATPSKPPPQTDSRGWADDRPLRP